MRVGVVIEETWSFFHEIYADLQQHFEISLYSRRELKWPIFTQRADRYYFHHDLEYFLQSNDVVFFEWASELLAYVSHLPKSCRIVARLHRYELYNWVEKINWDAVDRLILVTEAKQKEFLVLYPEQASKLLVIPEAVNLSRFTITEKEFTGDLGILGNLSPRKRVYELILAFAELLKVDDRFTLHIGGGRHPRFEDYYLALFRLVDLLELQNKITFYGNISNPEEWYPRIDIFISNSYNEGLQVSPLEAVASGCFAIAHHWSGADEFFPSECLFLTDQELIEKILRFAHSNPSDRQSQKDTLRTILRDHFDIDKTKVQIRRVIEEVGALPLKNSARF